MSEVKLDAVIRTTFGKGSARQTRRDNRVPAVIYGHGAEPVHVSLPGHDLMMALKTANVLISLDIEGRNELVIPKAIQRHPLKRTLTHVDLLAVKRGEKVSVEIAVNAEGDLAPGGNLLEHVLSTITVEAEATHIPEAVTVSVAGLDAGASVLAKDIVLPAGTTLVTDADAVVLQVLAAQAEESAAEGDAAAEA
ncbi:50S ribosomal protein L25/general stress protein Ctc [Streptomyces sp. NPDC050504]|uniref:50S ribosomal protein L25/general stress protein Ctc n=1 Tax=Streptomyces sp. NPDC050504 TaxID=3365618 RepID=UPI0037A7B6A6